LITRNVFRDDYYKYNTYFFPQTCVHSLVLVTISNCSTHGYGSLKITNTKSLDRTRLEANWSRISDDSIGAAL
jgi:hypothetical protein